MRILIICPEYPPRNIGGGGIVYRNLAKNLTENGHDVQIIAGNFKNRKIFGHVEKIHDEQLSVNFVPLIFSPKFRRFNLETYTPPTFFGLLFLIKKILKTNNEIVHLHGLCHPIIDFAAFICVLSKKKYIFTCHGIPKSPATSGFFWRKLYDIYLALIGRFVIKNAVAVTFISKSLLSECKLENLVNENMSVIPNGVDNELQNVKSLSFGELDKKHKLKGKKIIFAIGRLNQTKGFQHLINAMPKIIEELPETILVIAGVGPYEGELKKQIQKKNLLSHVKLVGWVDEPEKKALYECSDVVIFPSTYEPFGLVILEAMSMKKPLIAFRTSSAKELMKNDIIDITVPVADENALSRSIIKILLNNNLKNEIIEMNLKRLECFDWSKITKKYVSTYHKALVNHK